MKLFIRLTVLSLALLPAIISAQQPEPHPLNGIWKGTLTVDGAEVRLDVRIEGDVVTGPIMSPAGALEIQSGKLTPEGLVFSSAPLHAGDRQVTLVWTGQPTSENTISFVVSTEDLQDPSFELNLTRLVDQ